MPFDAELPIRTGDSLRRSCPIQGAPDPAPELAEADPDRLLAFLYVSPRPCAALDALLGA
jgi:hypothetical protein